ncbi:MAG: helix-turn-helix transcriptional regulator [Lachnospiraceae bacterium]|nr:helix-turn-helix transcriptional regulator [Lachnospiraceae bacterium]
MKSCEKFVAESSDYFIYSPSKSALEMFFYPLQCGHFIYEPGYFLHRESYDSFLLMYIQNGELTMEFDDAVSCARQGHFVLLDCYKSHSYYSDSGCECLWCHFDGPLARSWFENILSHSGSIFSLQEPYGTINKLQSVFDIFCSGHPVREPLMSKLLTDILTAFMLQTPQNEKSHNYVSMAEETITYINEHFREDITVEMLADRVGLSQYHFIRTFKKETGYTPHEYIVNTRIATAKYLLKNTRLSVKNICFDSGFSCESVFCSAFKRHQAMTPAQYRALMEE